MERGSFNCDQTIPFNVLLCGVLIFAALLMPMQAAADDKTQESTPAAVDGIDYSAKLDEITGQLEKLDSGNQEASAKLDGVAADLKVLADAERAKQEEEKKAAKSEPEKPEYAEYFNSQVVGDFFFLMVADTVILCLLVGGQMLMAFRPR